MTAIKDFSARWIFSAWQSIEQRSELAINGFQNSGISEASSSAKKLLNIDHILMIIQYSHVYTCFFLV